MPTKVISMDNTSAIVIDKLYQELDHVYTELNHPPYDQTLQQKMSDFAQHLLHISKAKPNLLFAQPQLYKAKFTPALNQCFNTLVYTILMASNNKLDDGVQRQLIHAVLFLSVLTEPKAKSEIAKKASMGLQREILLFLKSEQWQICRHVIKIKNDLLRYINKRSTSLARLDPLQLQVFIAAKLAKLTTLSETSSPNSFAVVLKKTCQEIPQNGYVYLRPLLNYPTLIPPGTCFKDKEDKLQITLAILKKQPVYIPLIVTSGIVDKPQVAIDIKKIIQIFAAQKLTGNTKLDSYWGENFQQFESEKATLDSPWQKKINIGSPPASLLAIQAELLKPSPNVARLVEILEQESAFSIQLQNLASASNRLLLPIVTSRHGLLMNGFDRSYQALLQHSLLSRLSQDVYPLQQNLVNFTQLLCYTADTLGVLNNSKYQHIVANVCLFAISYYFISPAIRTRLHWHTKPSARYKLSQLFTIKQAEQSAVFPLKLAKAWQQPPEVIQALQQLLKNNASEEDKNTPKSDIVCIIGLAMIISRAIYFSDNTVCALTEQFQQEAISQLKLGTLNLQQTINKIAQDSQVYCHLRS